MSAKYELGQRVSWTLRDEVKVGCIVSIDLNSEGVSFYALLEDGTHPRNGCYTRLADEIGAI